MCILLTCLFVSCSSQRLERKTLSCGLKTVTIELPTIIKVQEFSFTDGRTTFLTTKDLVMIEFYCGGNYAHHVSNEERFKVLSKTKESSKGIDIETNLYLRKDINLIYSNCKVNDTAYYNKVLNDKIVKK